MSPRFYPFELTRRYTPAICPQGKGTRAWKILLMRVLVYFDWPVKFWNVPPSHVERLRDRFPDVTFTYAENETEALTAAAETDIILSPRLRESTVQSAPRLQWIQSSASSVSPLPLSELAARKIPVTNTRSVQGFTIAEHAMGGLLVLSRRFDRTLAAQCERRWIQDELVDQASPWSLRGKSMTILGLGSIGQEVARRAHAFDIKTTGIRRRVNEPKPDFVDRVLPPTRLDEGLRNCDVLVISAPFLPETDCLIRAEQIALLNHGAILINVARGKIVDQDAMIAAIQTRHLGGAVLDVFDREPLDPSSSLWTLPNVIVTPHIASARPDHWDDVIDLFSENLRRFQRREPLLNIVDYKAGY